MAYFLTEKPVDLCDRACGLCCLLNGTRLSDDELIKWSFTVCQKCIRLYYRLSHSAGIPTLGDLKPSGTHSPSCSHCNKYFVTESLESDTRVNCGRSFMRGDHY